MSETVGPYRLSPPQRQLFDPSEEEKLALTSILQGAPDSGYNLGLLLGARNRTSDAADRYMEALSGVNNQQERIATAKNAADMQAERMKLTGHMLQFPQQASSYQLSSAEILPGALPLSQSHARADVESEWASARKNNAAAAWDMTQAGAQVPQGVPFGAAYEPTAHSIMGEPVSTTNARIGAEGTVTAAGVRARNEGGVRDPLAIAEHVRKTEDALAAHHASLYQTALRAALTDRLDLNRGVLSPAPISPEDAKRIAQEYANKGVEELRRRFGNTNDLLQQGGSNYRIPLPKPDTTVSPPKSGAPRTDSVGTPTEGPRSQDVPTAAPSAPVVPGTKPEQQAANTASSTTTQPVGTPAPNDPGGDLEGLKLRLRTNGYADPDAAVRKIQEVTRSLGIRNPQIKVNADRTFDWRDPVTGRTGRASLQ